MHACCTTRIHAYQCLLRIYPHCHLFTHTLHVFAYTHAYNYVYTHVYVLSFSLSCARSLSLAHSLLSVRYDASTNSIDILKNGQVLRGATTCSGGTPADVTVNHGCIGRGLPGGYSRMDMAGLVVAEGYISNANAIAIGAQLENGLGSCDYAIDAVELVAGVTPQLPIDEVFDCIPCQEGYYKDMIGSAQCLPSCVRGTYQNHRAATSAVCNTCPHGTFSAGGASTCASCGANSDSLAGSAEVESCGCNLGYASMTGAGPCEACAMGTYANTTASKICFPCQVGYTTNFLASNSSDECVEIPPVVIPRPPCPSGSYRAKTECNATVTCQGSDTCCGWIFRGLDQSDVLLAVYSNLLVGMRHGDSITKWGEFTMGSSAETNRLDLPTLGVYGSRNSQFVRFDRARTQYLQYGGALSLNYQSAGGITVITRVRFPGAAAASVRFTDCFEVADCQQ